MELPSEMYERIMNSLIYSKNYDKKKTDIAMRGFINNPLAAIEYFLKLEGQTGLIKPIVEFCKNFKKDE